MLKRAASGESCGGLSRLTEHENTMKVTQNTMKSQQKFIPEIPTLTNS